MNNYVKAVEMHDGETYQVRTRLGWGEQAQIDDAAGSYVFVLDGQTLSGIDQLQAVLSGEGDSDYKGDLRVEFKQNTAHYIRLRLRARLVGLNLKQITALSRSHVAQLIAFIEHCEEAEEAEIKALLKGNPTKKLSVN